MPSHQLTALASLRVSKHLIPAHNLIPNTSLQQKPLLLYHGAFPSSITAAEIESHLASVAVVEPQWRYTMYTRIHFHSTTHEVLCVSRGRARLCFGGEANEARFEPVVETGDFIVVPAGSDIGCLRIWTGALRWSVRIPMGGSGTCAMARRARRGRSRPSRGCRGLQRTRYMEIKARL
ncbi:cupin domain-containing protein [Verticillium alfalfae VaMs.102]|uniref:Cupin domain-containing protein n=1 Tax=Verticillium alfalfae (strain VaMs.102 / ATCC MYA-4576 / FGSC 10136) TaxID=526221 RepID=C9SLP4_VERA1|nr:cupin domain-containing protein [Verticillium alfalfae VaMs.102]EEY19612.1 cupin domain-containing protein [Verticillium alfalfae VaMs.102]